MPLLSLLNKSITFLKTNLWKVSPFHRVVLLTVAVMLRSHYQSNAMNFILLPVTFGWRTNHGWDIHIREFPQALRYVSRGHSYRLKPVSDVVEVH